MKALHIPKVSVCMPAFNSSATIAAAINSVLNQTFEDFELIVIDDGSTDDTCFVVNALGDPRIRLIHNNNKSKFVDDKCSRTSSASARNLGLQHARGQYIALLDSDDISLPHRLRTQIDYLEKNPAVGLCGSNGRHMNSDGMLLGPNSGWLKLPLAPVEWLLLWENPIAQSSVVLRKQTIQSHDFKYRLIGGEDGDLWCRMVIHTKAVILPEVLLHYRLSNDSIYHSQKQYYNLQAMESSHTLAEVVLARPYSTDRKDLTIFRKAMGAAPQPLSIQRAIEIMTEHLKASEKYWQWTPEQKNLAAIDACRRLVQYNAEVHAIDSFRFYAGVRKFASQWNVSLTLQQILFWEKAIKIQAAKHAVRRRLQSTFKIKFSENL